MFHFICIFCFLIYTMILCQAYGKTVTGAGINLFPMEVALE